MFVVWWTGRGAGRGKGVGCFHRARRIVRKHGVRRKSAYVYMTRHDASYQNGVSVPTTTCAHGEVARVDASRRGGVVSDSTKRNRAKSTKKFPKICGFRGLKICEYNKNCPL